MLHRPFALFLTVFAGASLATAAVPPNLRLDGSVRPLRYAVDLTLLPDATSFSGIIDIEVQLEKPTSLIWLNATGLTIQEAQVAAKTIETASVVPGGDDFIGLSLPQPTPAGPPTIHIRYQGKISEKNSEGIFQGRDGKELYLFTQFESIDARRAFPCFDQPDFKTPWQLSLRVRQEHKAFANTPQVSETAEPGGMKRVMFAPSKPLPSYLVAFAVGPFDVVDAGTAGRNRIPVRIVTPKGKAYQAKYAAEVTGPILDRLENYFGTSYPYEKLDEVAIPLTFGFGAMENAGLVTYAQTVILSDPALDTATRQRNYADDAAHELAHQWFGDLVTLAWWDDTWLNEAFATWTSSKIIAEWQPSWNSRLGDLSAKFGAMSDDSLVTTRKIHQPIQSKDDISNAFDGITYEKGSAVIRMFETWVGEPQFQAGVRSYLKLYAYRNATLNDFLDAISNAGQPKLTRAFSTFLDQPGFPEISVELSCSAAPAVVLSQKRFLPIGSSGSNDETWQVPVCVRYQTAGGAQKECFLLDKPRAEFPLAKAAACPAYLSANHQASGYYVTRYGDDTLRQLVKNGGEFLDPAERRTLLHDLQALADAGDARESDALAAAPLFAKAPERQIVSEAQSVTGSVQRMVPANLRPNYARYIRGAFGERAAQLGWSAKPSDDRDTRLMRVSLVPFVAVAGEDAAMLAAARRLADGWLKDRKGVDPDMLGAVLSTAAYSGDRALFDALRAALPQTSDLQQRRLIITAMGSFRDPKIVQSAMDLILHSDIDARETVYLLYGPLGNPETENLPFEFVKANYDALLKRLPSGGGTDSGALLPLVGSALCEEPSRKEFTAFFEDRVKNFTGGPRNYDQVVEAIRLCEAKRSAQSSDVADFLSRQ
jgi:alanyl aminopeptidase